MQLARQGFGESDPHFAATLGNLGGILQLQRRYQEAEPMYREVRLCLVPMGLCVALRCTYTCRGPAIPSLTSTKQSGIGHDAHTLCRVAAAGVFLLGTLCL